MRVKGLRSLSGTVEYLITLRQTRCGSGAANHIQLPEAADRQCVFIRERGGEVRVKDLAGETYIGDMRVRDAYLDPGQVLRLGPLEFLVIGDAGESPRVLVLAETLAEFLDKAVAARGGNVHGTARAIGVPYGTLYGWLTTRKWTKRLRKHASAVGASNKHRGSDDAEKRDLHHESGPCRGAR